MPDACALMDGKAMHLSIVYYEIRSKSYVTEASLKPAWHDQKLNVMVSLFPQQLIVHGHMSVLESGPEPMDTN